MIIAEKWAEIIRDMEGDDIILEIKVSNADLEMQNALLKFLRIKKYNVKYFFAGLETHLPSTVTLESFSSVESKKLVIDLQTCKLHFYFNDSHEMEFYTDSVLNLNYIEATPIFNFINQLGWYVNSKIHLYIESYPKHSYEFDPTDEDVEQ